LIVPNIDTTIAVAVFLLFIGMLAAVRAAMPSRARSAENSDKDPNSDQANAAVSRRE
jgi:hypothetical protein